MIVDRRKALGLLATTTMLGIGRPAQAQDALGTAELIAKAIESLQSPELVTQQRVIFSFYVELLRKKRPDDVSRALGTAQLLDEVIGKSKGQTEVKLLRANEPEVISIFSDGREKMREFLIESGIKSPSAAMDMIETSYVAMLMFFGTESVSQGRAPLFRESSWCCWPVCF
ncbi:hypothetical protein NKH36_33130 [Mesorhizobium sp. M1312]|uniref:hypothetical protein n=1 Tax=unclassified Mesorhizobium TaxID=325217 RepID=UPI000FE857C7|nr:hypothetical protein [Mesorhizobium sp.]RWO21750.1 MAG: hypothetical protein EOS09_22340 [Mesorhizobium sp.]